MRCPFCNHDDTQVKDSRPTEDGSSIRRRRFCPACHSRFTTFERVQLRELIVVKSDGEKRVFDREKIARSMAVALRKRPVEPEAVEMAVNRMVQKLESEGESEIATTRIGQLVMAELKKLDEVAYVRYASVYRDFREAKDFESFVENEAL
jgi:transcriptional repressor NrdR